MGSVVLSGESLLVLAVLAVVGVSVLVVAVVVLTVRGTYALQLALARYRARQRMRRQAAATAKAMADMTAAIANVQTQAFTDAARAIEGFANAVNEAQRSQGAKPHDPRQRPHGQHVSGTTR